MLIIKRILIFALVFVLLFNTYVYKKEVYANSVSIPNTYVDDYITTLIVLMGMTFTTQMERDLFVQTFKEQNSMYAGDILEEAERILIEYNKNQLPPLPGQSGPGNDKKMIAIPIIPGLMEKLGQHFKTRFGTDNSILSPQEFDKISSYVNINYPGKTYFVLNVNGPFNNFYNPFYPGDRIVFVSGLAAHKPPYTTTLYYVQSLGITRLDIFNKDGNRENMYILLMRNGVINATGIGDNAPWSEKFALKHHGSVVSEYKTHSFSSTSTYVPPVEITFPKTYVSPYTGMQTITLPHPSASRLPIPLNPNEYFEPVPDIYPNMIPTPQLPPNINPETGLPYTDQNGVPILTPNILVPGVDILPVPETESLTQPKDYGPILTRILNGIRQIPENIVNPVKNLIVPPEVPKVDFSPLSVPMTRKFPFSIPWDIKTIYTGFAAAPVAPIVDIKVPVLATETVVTVDFNKFNEIAEIIRYFILALFALGLALVTRTIIRG